MRSTLITTSLATLVLSTSAFADIRVKFDEGAPKDRFTISNVSGCTLEKGEVVIDLSSSAAGLIFDTTNQGAGVEVFQPLEFTRGQAMLSKMPKVKDGDNKVTLAFKDFKNGDAISFTIDVDDTIGQREITVSSSEITGAAFMVKTMSGSASAKFDGSATAQTKSGLCL